MTLIGSSHAHPCRLCGALGCACGATTTTPGTNPLRPEEAHVRGEPVHEYDVHANGYDTIMNLTETDAQRYPGAKKRSGPTAPDRTERPADPAADTAEKSAASKQRSAPNK